jgi:UDP-2,3-diacylglucosamine pyrophosphatase LpxH
VKLVGLGDIHAPYIDALAVTAALNLVAQLKPDVVVQVGDAYEFDNGSNWRATAERERPSDEFARGRRTLEEIWQEVRRVAPKARCIQMMGNHDERLVKRAFEKVPEAAHMVRDGVRQMMTFPGVELDESELVPLGRFAGEEWCAVHGFKWPGAHAAMYASNVLCGHLHRGYTMTVPGGYQEVNAGWLGENDHHSKFYARARKQNWNHGVAVIDDLGPRFVRFR